MSSDIKTWYQIKEEYPEVFLMLKLGIHIDEEGLELLKEYSGISSTIEFCKTENYKSTVSKIISVNKIADSYLDSFAKHSTSALSNATNSECWHILSCKLEMNAEGSLDFFVNRKGIQLESSEALKELSTQLIETGFYELLTLVLETSELVHEEVELPIFSQIEELCLTHQEIEVDPAAEY